jgi:hypothetical protein
MILVHLDDKLGYDNDVADLMAEGGCTDRKCKRDHISMLRTALKPEGLATRPKQWEIT